VREIRTLRVMRRELETGARGHLRPTAPVPDPTSTFSSADAVFGKDIRLRRVRNWSTPFFGLFRVNRKITIHTSLLSTIKP